MIANEHRCWVEVSRRRIAENFRAVRDLVGSGVEVMPVVKADAYGHGAVEVSRVLEAEGARWLAVSSVAEAVTLREAGLQAGILVMTGFLPHEAEALAPLRLTPVLHDPDAIASLERLAETAGRPLEYHLKIDTGMTRLGTRAGAATIAAAVKASGRARLQGLMTHFASAGNYESGQTEGQMRAFEEILSALRAAGVDPPFVHAASTIAIAYGRRDAWHNLVRPGHAIYGYVSPARGPAPHVALSVRPALSWHARVLTVRDVPAGSRIGYGGTFETPSPMRIGVLSAGYADGIPHRLSGRGKVIAGGHLVPMMGAVSMDVTTIDLTSCPDVRPGDAVTLLGREGGAELDAQQIARAAGTLSYSVLCGIGARVRRVYVDG